MLLSGYFQKFLFPGAFGPYVIKRALFLAGDGRYDW